MRWIGRLLLLAFALPVSISCGTLFLIAASVFDPLVATFLADTVWTAFGRLFEAAFAHQDPVVAEQALLRAGRLVTSLLVVPPVFVALVGEVAGLRSFLWYAGATAALSGAVPWLLSGMSRPAMPEEVHIATLLALSGAVTGFVHWLIAGHSAGARRPLPPIATSPRS